MTVRRILFWGCVWAVVFGLLNGLSNILLLPLAQFISLRPQVTLPMAVGILVHPGAGFFAGFIGNMIGDTLCGFGAWTFWNWHLANGIMGLVPGLMIRPVGEKIASVKDFGLLQTGVISACILAVLAAVTLDVVFLRHMTFPSSFYSWVLPAFLTNIVNGFILVPAILLAARKIAPTFEIRTIVLVTALLLVAVFGTAGAIAWSIKDFLESGEALIRTFYIAGLVSVFLLLAGFLTSILFVRRFTQPLTKINRAAEELEKGEFNVRKLDEVSARRDELGRLAGTFQEMAAKIQEREKRLKDRVKEMRIEIDRTRQAEDVAKIVETDYFKELRSKAKDFRGKSKGGLDGNDESGGF